MRSRRRRQGLCATRAKIPAPRNAASAARLVDLIILKSTKRAALAALRGAGIFALVAHSPWRRRRLLILCYHGFSLDDEHQWNPSLYIQPRLFEERLKLLERANVLPLTEGL